MPGCAEPISVFVGPRRESFSIALGEIFDLLNVSPVGAPVRAARNTTTDEDFNGGAGDGNSLDRFSVISFVIEVPQSCIVSRRNGRILGTWASVRRLEHDEGKHFAGEQTTRLGNPLVNELVIGTTYKNEWNSRHPSGDERFNDFLLFPAVPAIAQLLFGTNGSVLAAGADAPAFPRTDLIAVLHTGIPNFNKPENTANGRDKKPIYADLLRINLDVAAFKNCSDQNSFTVLANASSLPAPDFGGYPNGRRLGDDIVDIVLRVVEGALCATSDALGICSGGRSATGTFLFGDNVPIDACQFQCGDDDFPFLNPPLPGDQLWKVTATDAYKTSQWADRGKSALGHCTSAPAPSTR